MTKLEKMAEDAAKKSRWSNSYGHDFNEEAAFADGYIVGFKAARATMVAAVKDQVGPAGLLTVGCDPKMWDEEVE